MKRFKRSPPATDLLEPTLVWQQPDGTSADVRIPLARAITIGRDAENTLAIDSAFVSKTHASVRLTDGQCIIEDLQSANGTRVNGQPVATLALTLGDVIDLGDHSLTFVDRGTRDRSSRRVGASQSKGQPAPAAKLLRLALAAVITGGVMLVALRLMLPGETTTAASATSRAAVTSVSPERVRQLTRFIEGDSARVREVAAAASHAGVAPADALFDEGEIQRRAGRFLQAAQLFAATFKAQPDHPTARARLNRSLMELERMVTTLLAGADRQAGELRWGEAATTWGRVAAALPPGDPRVARSRASREEALRHVARPEAFD